MYDHYDVMCMMVSINIVAQFLICFYLYPKKISSCFNINGNVVNLRSISFSELDIYFICEFLLFFVVEYSYGNRTHELTLLLLDLG